jgi:hypothetical protein
MSAIFHYISSLPYATEEVDLSAFERIEEFDDRTWNRIKGDYTENWKRVKLPPLQLTIKDSAFHGRSRLTDVTFPSSLRRLGDGAFRNCSGLAMNDMKLPDSLEYLGSSGFSDCTGLTGKLSTHITGNSSFAGCTGLTELDLNNCITVIEYG